MSITPPTLAHVIGRGTYGVVHAATSADGAPVAVKVVPATDSTTAADLEREIELMRGFAHPNIVGFVTAFATTGAEIWVVMELCACSLSSVLRRGPLAAAAAGGAMHTRCAGWRTCTSSSGRSTATSRRRTCSSPPTASSSSPTLASPPRSRRHTAHDHRHAALDGARGDRARATTRARRVVARRHVYELLTARRRTANGLGDGVMYRIVNGPPPPPPPSARRRRRVRAPVLQKEAEQRASCAELLRAPFAAAPAAAELRAVAAAATNGAAVVVGGGAARRSSEGEATLPLPPRVARRTDASARQSAACDATLPLGGTAPTLAAATLDPAAAAAATDDELRAELEATRKAIARLEAEMGERATGGEAAGAAADDGAAASRDSASGWLDELSSACTQMVARLEVQMGNPWNTIEPPSAAAVAEACERWAWRRALAEQAEAEAGGLDRTVSVLKTGKAAPRPTPRAASRSRRSSPGRSRPFIGGRRRRRRRSMTMAS